VNLTTASTSYIERQNLAMECSRFSSFLGKAFVRRVSRRFRIRSVLRFFPYNFITFHKTLKMPPVMKAGVAKEPWSYEQLVELVETGGTL
jgi:hypothetical protein